MKNEVEQSKTEQPKKKGKVAVGDPGAKDKQVADAHAKFALRPSLNAAAVIDAYAKSMFTDLDMWAVVDNLSSSMKELNNGDMSRCENMLFGQANALQSMFVSLSQRASKQEYLSQFETYLKLALKAQNQCRMTLETLATIKNPPVVYAKQANIAHGPQQVNNGVPAHAGENQNQPNELSEENNELRQNTGTPALESQTNQTVEAVGAIHRAEVAGR
ncbi:MAG: hypothetical protein M0Z78_05875 [Betaproteobacteria bacterium]|nr:hypothetical protein [Betaproteobacteria bacterium]